MKNYSILICMWLLASSPIWSAEGVTEINQFCALQTGCFAGDSPGFPITIAAESPANYILTSDLDLSGLAVDPSNLADFPEAVLFTGTVKDYTLDLNGFSIKGPNECEVASTETSTDVSCTYSDDNQLGINNYNFEITNFVTIKNGTIANMIGRGIRCSRNCILSNLLITHNGSDGIFADRSSQVIDSEVRHNGADGLVLGAESLARNNSISMNHEAGISALTQAHVFGNSITNNGGSGLRCVGCKAQHNFLDGNAATALTFSLITVTGGNWIDAPDAIDATSGTPTLVAEADLCKANICPYGSGR